MLKEITSLTFDEEAIDRLVEQHVGQHTPSEDPQSVAPLHCCPRSYEELFLREPIGSERPCGRDLDCEGKKLPNTPGFVLREFIYPGTDANQQRMLCLLCRRYEISRAYYKHETSPNAVAHNMRISDHYNLVGIPGEYDVRDCIVSGSTYTGLPMPVVLHCRSAYTCDTKDGVRVLRQSRMRCPGVSESDTQGCFLARRALSGTTGAHLHLDCPVKSN